MPVNPLVVIRICIPRCLQLYRLGCVFYSPHKTPSRKDLDFTSYLKDNGEPRERLQESRLNSQAGVVFRNLVLHSGHPSKYKLCRMTAWPLVSARAPNHHTTGAQLCINDIYADHSCIISVLWAVHVYVPGWNWIIILYLTYRKHDIMLEEMKYFLLYIASYIQRHISLCLVYIAQFVAINGLGCSLYIYIYITIAATREEMMIRIIPDTTRSR